MSTQVVGRTAELDELARLLDDASAGDLTVAMWLAVLGFVELSAGHPMDADRRFCQAEERLSG